MNAVMCESMRAQEETWNQDVHYILLQTILSSSYHTESLAISSMCVLTPSKIPFFYEADTTPRARKTATIDPKDLTSKTLPKRVIDYSFVLKPDTKIKRAWEDLQPLPGVGVKSWNNTTRNDVRRDPIAISVETKAPNRSWTDGKPQVGIWIGSLLKRLRMLPEYDRGNPAVSRDLKIPAIPLVIAQGHDWHLLIVSQTSDRAHQRTTIWQKIDMGSTRNCFDAYKVVAILLYLVNWAEKTWRPWFHTLINRS